MSGKDKSKSGKRGGAQPGNKNALKHGFYSQQFTIEETKRLNDSGDLFALDGEIALLRVCLDRLAETLDFDERALSDENGNTVFDERILRQLSTLGNLSQSLATLVRTHYLTRGKGGAVEKGIIEALDELRLEMGL